MANLSRLSNAKSRSISPENRTGEAGKGGMTTSGTGATAARNLGRGWKISPSLDIAAGETCELAHIKTGGAIQHIWITALEQVQFRDLILRMYWDNQHHPSVEVPLGDFFCAGLLGYAHVSSLAVCVNPGRGMNCFWEMPYRNSARITLENRDESQATTVYYQIDYTETDVSQSHAYFHAQFRRTNPIAYKGLHTIVSDLSGTGHYVGTYMTWGVHNSGWWGEGEVKFYINDDGDFPTICGTGTEDYFLGAYNFDIGAAFKGMPGAYTAYSTPYAGVPHIQRPDGVYNSQQRFGMYRWHITDPVRFEKRLKVTIQALGWRNFNNWGDNEAKREYLPLQDDVSSVAFWYQTLPGAIFPPLPAREFLEIN